MLARRYRFHGYGSLQYLFRHGKTIRGRYILLRYIKNERRPHGRISVIVSKKIAKSAVVRNRIRRRVFEAIRLQQPRFEGAHDLAFIIVSQDIIDSKSTELVKDIETTLQRARIWHSNRSQTD
ncbi:MAG TPA: ribonuclease P protein component [Candidatus Saccharimonadales bacterium]